jgi:hypothetical protein
MRRTLWVFLVMAWAVTAVGSATAQQPAPPDPAILQYVESFPTTTGAKVQSGTAPEQGSASGPDAVASAAGQEAMPTDLVWLGSAVFVLTAGALVFVAIRARRRHHA